MGASVPADVFVVTSLDTIPALWHVSFEGGEDLPRVSLKGAFAAHRLPPDLSESTWPAYVLHPLDSEVSEVGLEPFLNALNATVPDRRPSLRVLRLDTCSMMASYLFPEEHGPLGETEVILPHYFGIHATDKEFLVLMDSPKTLPCHAVAMFRLQGEDEELHLGYFKGCFPDPAYCHRFRPLQISWRGTDTFLVRAELSDWFGGYIDVRPCDPGARKSEAVYKRNYEIPVSTLFG